MREYESMMFNENNKNLKYLLIIPALLLLTGAFSNRSRQEILERDGYRCTECGATEHLEAAHYNHDRNNPDYDHPTNGRALCTKDHLKDHQKRHGANGLPKAVNKWAINKIHERLKDQ